LQSKANKISGHELTLTVTWNRYFLFCLAAVLKPNTGDFIMAQVFNALSSAKRSSDPPKINADGKWHQMQSAEVSYLIAKFLAERGVDRIFSLCGGHILPMWDHAARLGIRIIDVRDERAAVHMAQAHTEFTGNLGVAMVTAGPGMTNAVTGIANAHISRVPVLVISGRPPRPQEFMGALQDLPQVEIIKPITRYARTIHHANHVLRELDEALACAGGQGNEPGPAFVDFPTDLLREKIPVALVDKERFATREVFHPDPPPEAVNRALDILWSARRPVVISGRGARGAGRSITRLIDTLGCVYLDTAESRGLVPDDHPASMPAVRGRAMQESDVVLALGRSLDFQLGYGSPAVFPGARFVRVGTSAAELRSNRRADVEVHGSISTVLDAISDRLGQGRLSIDAEWIDDLRRHDRMRRDKLQQQLAQAAPGADGAMHPYRLLGCLKSALNREAVIVADGGDILSFARVALTGGKYLDCGGFGCLGVGVPFGIAAALAYPDNQVVVVCGDGSFGINAIDLDTARRHDARVVFVVANNYAWNIELNDQMASYGGRIVGTELPSCDYAGLARALGLHAERVEDPDKLTDALEQAFEKAPSLLDVVVTRDAVSPDGQSGIPLIPKYQPLVRWDEMERVRRGAS
jgi:acetolactate synthase-1/2/3 large subunit